MRAKRAKQYKKAMNIYKNAYGFREPFQILVGSDFVLECLQSKISIIEQLTKTVGHMKVLITNCSIQDLRNSGESNIGAVVLARKFEKRRCTHTPTISGHQCIEEIIGDENKFNYCIAIQDSTVRSKFRNIPGIPLLHINRSIMILEPTSKASMFRVKQVEQEKISISKEEKLRLKKDLKDADGPSAPKSSLNKRKKRKGPKEPNPLSIKKPKKSSTSITKNPTTNINTHSDNTAPSLDRDKQSSPNVDGSDISNKPKRKRKRKSKNAQPLE
ncbi:rRNA-processing protein utp23 [Smittium mucronatum]|uniref:U three protein 23 n=1 Tax=Smittium mucronatum TaxID=133383 RepID=A0A1R0GWA2_9FUNG|nr:rRNA-processing protein utp23 [Smittium mucronatum]